MKDARITLVTLASDDLGKAAAFYEALGWRRTAAGNESVVFLQGAGIVLSLFGRADLAADTGLAPDSAALSPNLALAVNMASELDVDRLYATAVAAGAVAVKPPQTVVWGGYSGYFADPDGHLWEVAHNPFFPMTPEGNLTLEAGKAETPPLDEDVAAGVGEGEPA